MLALSAGVHWWRIALLSYAPAELPVTLPTPVVLFTCYNPGVSSHV
jgi:hypothetical protein